MTAESAEYWASSSSKAVRLAKFVTGTITGNYDDSCDNEAVQLKN